MDQKGDVVFRKRLRRSNVLQFFALQPTFEAILRPIKTPTQVIPNPVPVRTG
jgi:hypothetical protein